MGIFQSTEFNFLIEKVSITIKFSMNKSVTKSKAKHSIPRILGVTPNMEDKAVFEKALIMAMY